MPDHFVTYPAGAPFPGQIGRTLETSQPAWPERPTAPEGAPNVVVIVLDDVGYGQLSAFGGPCETPNLDALAARGLKYQNFHTTALCSPTRACLLTGRNHHFVGMSAITEMSMGYPAHNAMMGFEHGMLPEILVAAGYNTFCVGKWHLTPSQEATGAGPYTRWPLGRGFERYYGFMGGDTDQYHPELVYDNHSVRAPKSVAEGYHLNADLADHAIQFIQDAHASWPDKPFLLWYATGAGHAPHQVEREWADRYRGQFDGGWDELRQATYDRQVALGLVAPGTDLAVRDPDVPAWDGLAPDAQRVYARQMEVFAGFISQTDHHIGRVIDFIDELGELDNTIVVCVSDNGASAEGGVHGTRNEALFFNLAPETLEDNAEVIDRWGTEDTFNHYAWGWTWAGDTPFRRWKRETYRGGVTDPCIISWPKQIPARGEVRTQYLHAIDLLPTLLEVIGLGAPAEIRGVPQSPIQGVSFAPSLRDPSAPDRHTTQFFEMFGHRSIYHEGWKAVCPYPGPSLAEGAALGHPFGSPITEAILDELEAKDWELYHVAIDPTEVHNVAASEPEKLRDMRDLWWAEAERNHALPLASSGAQRLFARRPTIGPSRRVFTFYPGGSPITFSAAPRVTNRAHAITAFCEVPRGGAEGVLLSHGSRHGGYCLFVQGGRLRWVHNYLGLEQFRLVGDRPVPEGAVRLAVTFAPTGPPNFAVGKGSPAVATLFHNDDVVGVMDLSYSVPATFGTSGLSCGEAFFDSVDPTSFAAPFPFSGRLHQVVLDLSGDGAVNPASELVRLMAQQ